MIRTKDGLQGNSSTATTLKTARNFTIGNTTKSFNGSANVSWTLSEIGAAAADHTHASMSANAINSRGNVTCETGVTGRPAVNGLSMSQAYNNGYPTPYGNVISLKGTGDGQILIGWSGTDGAHAPVYVRSKRDNTSTANWSDWAQVYTTANKPTPEAIGAADEYHEHHTYIKRERDGVVAGTTYFNEIDAYDIKIYGERIYHPGNLPYHLSPTYWSTDDMHWVGNQASWNGGNKLTHGQIGGGNEINGMYPWGAFIQFGGTNATGQIYIPDNSARNEMYFRGTWGDKAPAWNKIWHTGNIGNPMPLWHKNSYWGMVANDGDGDWIRTTWNGILPFQMDGCSSLGTGSWMFNEAHIVTIQAHGGIYTNWIDDRIGASNWVCIDNASGANSQITLRPDYDNKGNLGHRNYTWNYANITSIGNAYSLRPTDAYSVSKFDNNDLMYDMVKNMNFYLQKEKSVEEFEEILQLQETEEYQNADEDMQKRMIKETEKSTPASYNYSKRVKLVANAEELPFEVAPENHMADGTRTIETGAFMAGLASALQKAIFKIEDLELENELKDKKIDELENRLKQIEQLISNSINS